jgi:nitrogen-specific signal transduction histidine kinase
MDLIRESEQQLVEADRAAIYQRNASLFLQGRLLLDFVWLLLILYPSSPPASSAWSPGAPVFFPIVDLLQLSVYQTALSRKPRSVPLVASLSVAFTSVGIAATLHLGGDFTAPAFLLYFVLIATGSIASPWVIAGITSFIYLLVAVVEMTGLARPASGMPVAALREKSMFVLLVIVGMWLVAFVMQQLSEMAERRQREQAHMVEESRRRVEAESIWGTVGKTIVATQDLDEVLTNVIHLLNEKMQVETGSVLLRESASDELYFAKTLRGNVEEFASFRVRLGQGIAGWVAQTGQSALVPDTAADPRWFSGVDQKTGFVTRSIVCVPLIAKGEIIGVIELLNKKNGTFTDADVHLLESIAAPVAIAIQNARLHRQVQQQLVELTKSFHQVENAKKEWEHTVDAIDEGIALVDLNSQILRSNRTLADWLRSTPNDLVGKYCYQIIHGVEAPPDYCPHQRALKDPTRICSAEFTEPHLNGSFLCTVYPFHDATGNFVGMVNVLKDITAQKRLQAHLIRSEKLAAVGQLATSLAHEINNPLQGIRGALELAREDIGDNPKPLEYLDMSQGEIDRLAKIVQRMLDFYRPATETAAPVDVRAVVEDILALSAKRVQHARVQVESEWEANLPLVNGFANQLKQVFLNLVLNAVDAMPNGGILRIRARLVEDTSRWLVVALTDSGEGIPPQDLDKVFDPFFTTKVNGTGLGLAICQTIVSSQGGRLTVDSTLGQGSTFAVWLPVE